jgi:isochorismate hydrolase
MNKRNKEELMKRIDSLEKKVKEERKWLRQFDTQNYFVESIQEEIQGMKKAVSNATR